jgi:hypothetical protein
MSCTALPSSTRCGGWREREGARRQRDSNLDALGWWIVRPEMSMKNRVFGVTGVFVGTDSL